MAPVDHRIAIPRFSLVVLLGASGAGKTTFCERWFPSSSIVSSDRCRWMVADDERADWASAEAFALLETWVTARLKVGRLTVVDSTALEPRFRTRMLDLAREFHAPAILVVLDQSQRVCVERDNRRERKAGFDAIGRQVQRAIKAASRARIEGWNRIITLKNEDIERAILEIRPLRVDSPIPPPYDLIGDIHGCFEELSELLTKLGYRADERCGYFHPEGRRVVFLGDLVDRGPASLKVVELVRKMHRAGSALVTPGNHDDKLLRYLSGGRVRLDHGLERTAAELEAVAEGPRAELISELVHWLRALPPYLILDRGRLVVAHAGLPEHLHGRLSRAVAAWALYGEARGMRLPNDAQSRMPQWPATYQGKAMVIYGHTPSAEARSRGNTVCIDQGCVFGGKLTAYRYPEGALVQVLAAETYYPDDAPDLEANHAGSGNEISKAGDEADAKPGETVTSSGAGCGEGSPGAESTSSASGEATSSHQVEGVDNLAARDSTSPLLSAGEGLEAESRESREASGESSKDAADQHDDSEASAGSSAASAPDPLGPIVEPRDGSGKSEKEEQASDSKAATFVEMPDLLPLLEGAGLPTSWVGQVQLRSHQVSEALEELNRSGIDPRWLVYIPSTIAPCAASARPDCLEHPAEMFRYFRDVGNPLVVEEMHLGTRVVAIIGRDEHEIRSRFGRSCLGMIYTRAARPYGNEEQLGQIMSRLRGELEKGRAFSRLGAKLLIFEACILPWSSTYEEFLSRQCLPASSCLLASRRRALEAIRTAEKRGVPVRSLEVPVRQDLDGARRLQEALAAYDWPDGGLASLRIAPIHLLATDKRTFMDMDRLWHLKELDRWSGASELFASARRVLVRDLEGEKAAYKLWDDICTGKGIGMIARTMAWFPRNGQRPDLPAMKVRSREFLRVIFGPQYLNPDILARLKERPLRSTRSVALKEWALACEGLKRLAAGATFAGYHPYALAVLASQYRPVDPRL